MHIEDAKKDIMELIIKLIQKGYCRYKLLNTFKQFTLKRMVPLGTFWLQHNAP